MWRRGSREPIWSGSFEAFEAGNLLSALEPPQQCVENAILAVITFQSIGFPAPVSDKLFNNLPRKRFYKVRKLLRVGRKRCDAF